MSNFPTPKEVPPTPQQVDATFRSALDACQSLLGMDIRHTTVLRSTIQNLYSHPTFQLLLGFPAQSYPHPPAPDKQLHAELADIKSTISALSKTVNSLQPKANGVQTPVPTPPSKPAASAQGKGPTQKHTPTYASKAAATVRPSLVLDLGQDKSQKQLNEELAGDINRNLDSIGYEDVKILAARYTKKGNLVLTAHHNTSQAQLNNATPAIKTIIGQLYNDVYQSIPENITARANVKWSKVLINSVPVGITDSRGPWTPDECHRALEAHNPSYAFLKVTQKPTWVRPPSTYQSGNRSSLVVAFEDPDGSVKQAILSNRQLYLLGVRAKVSRWKQAPHTSPTPPIPNAPMAESVFSFMQDEDSMYEDPHSQATPRQKRKTITSSPAGPNDPTSPSRPPQASKKKRASRLS